MLRNSEVVKSGFSGDFRRCLETGEDVSNERRYLSQWGKETYSQFHLNPIKDEEGKILNVLATFSDITYRKKMEEALEESEEKFREVFNNANDAVYLHEFPEDLPEFIDDFQAHVPENIPECDLILALDLKGDINMLEMGEYTYDKYLSHTVIGEITGNTQMQGSPTQNAIDDTMNDLFTDTAGGIVGALLGVYFIRRAEKRGDHWHVADEIEEMGEPRKES